MIVKITFFFSFIIYLYTLYCFEYCYLRQNTKNKMSINRIRNNISKSETYVFYNFCF